MKRTPLYNHHCKLEAKIIDFGGWELPLQYSGIIAEHQAVRRCAGLFDVSHMGEITVKGKYATGFIQKVITNDISRMIDLQARYSPMCFPDGGTADDILVYRFSSDHYLLVVNAGNTESDFDWLNENNDVGAELQNVSDQYAQLALQGPKAEEILQKLTKISLSEIQFFHFHPSVRIEGVTLLLSRTGYTGEDGFELYMPSDDAPLIWDLIMEAGEDIGLVPAGLGARDTLRFEAALPLYGHELSREITPLEAGLGLFVKTDKEYFIGKDILKLQKEQGVKRKLVGFEMIDRGVPRSHYEVCCSGRSVGFVTSGSYSPSLDKNTGLALVETDYALEGTELEIIIRNRPFRAIVVKKPFYKKSYKNKG